MADYLSTNTPRIRATQTGPRGTHKMNFRYFPAGDLAGAITEVRSICALMQPICWQGTVWASAEAAAEGSDVFLPVDWAPITTGATDNVADNTDEYGYYLNVIGRTTAGSRVAWYLYNVTKQVRTANNRLTGAENTNLTALIAGLNGASTILCGIDQNPFTMKAYGNTGINDKISKKSRSTV